MVHSSMARAALVALLGLPTLGCSAGGSTSDGGAGSDGQPGGGDAGSLCADFLACGGNVVGTWRIDPRCLPHGQVQQGACSGEEFDLTKVVSDATWAFRANLTMTITVTASGPATVKAPDSCLVSNGAPITCAEAGAMYASRIAFVGGKAGTASCQSAAGICTCVIPFVAAPVGGSGTYSLAGPALSYSLGTETTTVDYCVSSTSLKLRSRDANGAPKKVSVYTRQ